MLTSRHSLNCKYFMSTVSLQHWPLNGLGDRDQGKSNSSLSFSAFSYNIRMGVITMIIIYHRAASPSETIGIARNRDSQSSDRIELPRPATLRAEAKQDKIAICDKIIRIFLEKPSSQWRKLIAFSKQWSTLHERSAQTSSILRLPMTVLTSTAFWSLDIITKNLMIISWWALSAIALPVDSLITSWSVSLPNVQAHAQQGLMTDSNLALLEGSISWGFM